MSEERVAAEECTALGEQRHVLISHPGREAALGAVRITRALPIRDRRMVGPWCFLDRFGPLVFSEGTPMNVPPHPHIGLQTVSWLLEGEVLHSDSLEAQAVVRPGGLNVMTAGRGIVHAEETPAPNSWRLNGVQLWTALPEEHSHTEPSFASVEQVPVVDGAGGTIQLFAGTYRGISSPATYFSPIIGVDVQVHASQAVELELDPEFEHAAFVLAGEISVENQSLQERTLYYLGTRRTGLLLGSGEGGRVLLIGGPPFPEKILMWWNFVARTPEEIAQARSDWEEGRRFGEVVGEHDPRLPAPSLVRFARPNPVS